MPKHNKGKKHAKKASPHKKSSTAVQSGIRTVKGRGGYSEDIGSAIGKFIGGKLGSSDIGSSLGGMAGRLFKSVTGLGDYSVSGNNMSRNGPPQFYVPSTMIEHREYLGDIFSSNEFVNRIYEINPGISRTFPWLNNVARSYEQYELLGCIFEFRSTSSVSLNSTNTALGTVIMATDYDNLDEDFKSKLQMENHQFAVSAPPSISQLHPIECKKADTAQHLLYVRSDLADNRDLNLTDFGKFQLATTGMQEANVNIGELWCTYRLRLVKPQLYRDANESSIWYNPTSQRFNLFSQDVENLIPSELINGSNLLASSDLKANRIVFPPRTISGTYKLDIYNYLPSADAEKNWGNLRILTATNIEQKDVFQSLLVEGDTGTCGAPPAGLYTEANTHWCYRSFIFNIIGPNSSITFEFFGVDDITPFRTIAILTRFSDKIPVAPTPLQLLEQKFQSLNTKLQAMKSRDEKPATKINECYVDVKEELERKYSRR